MSTFPHLDGLGEEFAAEVRSQKAPWHNFLGTSSDDHPIGMELLDGVEDELMRGEDEEGELWK